VLRYVTKIWGRMPKICKGWWNMKKNAKNWKSGTRVEKVFQTL
jgi:hypothetical protein